MGDRRVGASIWIRRRGLLAEAAIQHRGGWLAASRTWVSVFFALSLFLQPKHGAFNNGSKTLFVVLVGHLNVAHKLFPSLLFQDKITISSSSARVTQCRLQPGTACRRRCWPVNTCLAATDAFRVVDIVLGVGGAAREPRCHGGCFAARLALGWRTVGAAACVDRQDSRVFTLSRMVMWMRMHRQPSL